MYTRLLEEDGDTEEVHDSQSSGSGIELQEVAFTRPSYTPVHEHLYIIHNDQPVRLSSTLRPWIQVPPIALADTCFGLTVPEVARDHTPQYLHVLDGFLNQVDDTEQEILLMSEDLQLRLFRILHELIHAWHIEPFVKRKGAGSNVPPTLQPSLVLHLKKGTRHLGMHREQQIYRTFERAHLYTWADVFRCMENGLRWYLLRSAWSLDPQLHYMEWLLKNEYVRHRLASQAPLPLQNYKHSTRMCAWFSCFLPCCESPPHSPRQHLNSTRFSLLNESSPMLLHQPLLYASTDVAAHHICLDESASVSLNDIQGGPRLDTVDTYVAPTPPSLDLPPEPAAVEAPPLHIDPITATTISTPAPVSVPPSPIHRLDIDAVEPMLNCAPEPLDVVMARETVHPNEPEASELESPAAPTVHCHLSPPPDPGVPTIVASSTSARPVSDEIRLFEVPAIVEPGTLPIEVQDLSTHDAHAIGSTVPAPTAMEYLTVPAPDMQTIIHPATAVVECEPPAVPCHVEALQSTQPLYAEQEPMSTYAVHAGADVVEEPQQIEGWVHEDEELRRDSPSSRRHRRHHEPRVRDSEQEVFENARAEPLTQDEIVPGEVAVRHPPSSSVHISRTPHRKHHRHHSPVVEQPARIVRSSKRQKDNLASTKHKTEPKSTHGAKATIAAVPAVHTTRATRVTPRVKDDIEYTPPSRPTFNEPSKPDTTDTTASPASQVTASPAVVSSSSSSSSGGSLWPLLPLSMASMWNRSRRHSDSAAAKPGFFDTLTALPSAWSRENESESQYAPPPLSNPSAETTSAPVQSFVDPVFASDVRDVSPPDSIELPVAVEDTAVDVDAVTDDHIPAFNTIEVSDHENDKGLQSQPMSPVHHYSEEPQPLAPESLSPEPVTPVPASTVTTQEVEPNPAQPAPLDEPDDWEFYASEDSEGPSRVVTPVETHEDTPPSSPDSSAPPSPHRSPSPPPVLVPTDVSPKPAVPSVGMVVRRNSILGPLPSPASIFDPLPSPSVFSPRVEVQTVVPAVVVTTRETVPTAAVTAATTNNFTLIPRYRLEDVPRTDRRLRMTIAALPDAFDLPRAHQMLRQSFNLAHKQLPFTGELNSHLPLDGMQLSKLWIELQEAKDWDQTYPNQTHVSATVYFQGTQHRAPNVRIVPSSATSVSARWTRDTSCCQCFEVDNDMLYENLMQDNSYGEATTALVRILHTIVVPADVSVEEEREQYMVGYVMVNIARLFDQLSRTEWYPMYNIAGMRQGAVRLRTWWLYDVSKLKDDLQRKPPEAIPPLVTAMSINWLIGRVISLTDHGGGTTTQALDSVLYEYALDIHFHTQVCTIDFQTWMEWTVTSVPTMATYGYTFTFSQVPTTIDTIILVLRRRKARPPTAALRPSIYHSLRPGKQIGSATLSLAPAQQLLCHARTFTVILDCSDNRERELRVQLCWLHQLSNIFLRG